MSGGHFDYNCFRFVSFADALETEIRNNNKKGEHIYSVNAKPETIKLLKSALCHIRKSAWMAKDIEFFYSGDIGEEALIERLKEMLD